MNFWLTLTIIIILSGLASWLVANIIAYQNTTFWWDGWDCYYLENQHESWELLHQYFWGRSLAFEHLMEANNCGN